MLPLLCALCFQDPTSLIDDLGDPDIEVRDRAQQKLVNIGGAALVSLEEAARWRSDSEVRGRAAAAILEIRRNERKAELKKACSPDLLGDAPDLAEIATSDRAGDWLRMIACATGYVRHENGLYQTERAWAGTTRADLIAIARCYLAGDWRDEFVQGLLFEVLQEAGCDLPEDVACEEPADRLLRLYSSG